MRKNLFRLLSIILIAAIYLQVSVFPSIPAYAETYVCNNAPNSGVAYDCGNLPLNTGSAYNCGNSPLETIYDCGNPPNSNYVYTCNNSPLNAGGTLCSPTSILVCNVCGMYNLYCGHQIGTRYNGTMCSPTVVVKCNICNQNYSSCPHTAGTRYGGVVCASVNGICNVCYTSYATCPHVAGTVYGGTICATYSVSTCNICGGTSPGCGHSSGVTYGGTVCMPTVVFGNCNICQQLYNSPSCTHVAGTSYFKTHNHVSGCGHWTVHYHDIGVPCPKHTVHNHTPSCPTGPTSHTHNGTCASHFTTHVHTAACLDTTPPTPPSNLVATVTGNNVSLTWTLSTDNVGVTNYYIYRGASNIGIASSGSYTDNSAPANTSLSYSVKAVDARANFSGASNTATAIIVVDVTPPTVPTNLAGSVSCGSFVNLTWTASTDNFIVSRYDIYCGDTKVGSAVSNAFCDVFAPKNSNLSYYVKAVDSSGNSSAASSTITVVTEDYGNTFVETGWAFDNCSLIGKINTPGDLDYICFVAQTSTTYTIRSSGNIDAYGCLYDSTHNLLSAVDDSKGLGLNFQITYNLVQGQTYFIRVSHLSALGTGDYGLFIVNSYIPLPNTAPTFSFTGITDNQLFDANSSATTTQITVNDLDLDSLDCRLFVDNEMVARSVRTTSSGSTGQVLTFEAINFGELVNGYHKIKFSVSDGHNYPTEKIVIIKVDKLAPENGSIGVSGNSNSITATIVTAPTDSMSEMPAAPYRYSIGSTVGAWTSSTSNQFTGLTSSTEYTIKVEAKDNSGNIKVFEQTVTTAPQTSTVSTSNVARKSFEINVTDSNPSSTQYQIMVGTKYVGANGRLSTTPKWITLKNKKINVIGLTANTAYSYSVVSRNIDDGITATATGSVSTTN